MPHKQVVLKRTRGRMLAYDFLVSAREQSTLLARTCGNAWWRTCLMQRCNEMLFDSVEVWTRLNQAKSIIAMTLFEIKNGRLSAMQHAGCRGLAFVSPSQRIQLSNTP